ncbi:MAG: YtxH domain-containing protein [Chitinophagales bacterium]
MSVQKMMIAALAGVVIGVLIAPAKGSETRQKISDSAENLRSRLKRVRSSSREELDELRDVFEHEVEGLREDVRQKILKLITKAVSGYNHIRKEALSN